MWAPPTPFPSITVFKFKRGGGSNNPWGRLQGAAALCYLITCNIQQHAAMLSPVWECPWIMGRPGWTSGQPGQNMKTKLRVLKAEVTYRKHSRWNSVTVQCPSPQAVWAQVFTVQLATIGDDRLHGYVGRCQTLSDSVLQIARLDIASRSDCQPRHAVSGWLPKPRRFGALTPSAEKQVKLKAKFEAKFEAKQREYSKCWSLDINSCFPSQLQTLF